ncbi:hypothetical protein [Calidithermus chliarophilus]|uniref:hypothetical protein n=1 Tax=Calidithermus chliarophilus TaxID=52023 RepID=UPI0004081E06|nr:hypothetical protein [Calidithermus chliarophilus]
MKDDTHAARGHLARLAGQLAACEAADRRIKEAAKAIHEHHDRRAAVIREHLGPLGADEGLEDEYLASLRERHYAARY